MGMTVLRSYVNSVPGALHDHWATTWRRDDHPTALFDYAEIETLGEVLRERRDECECAVEVIGMVDEQWGLGGEVGRPGLFARLNHRNIREGDKKLDSYLLTGESFFCVPKYGECGASVALRQWQSEVEYDTMVTTNTSLDGALGISSLGVLCYIWPFGYLAGHSAPRFLHKDSALSHSAAHLGIECPTLNSTNGQWTLSDPQRSPGTIARLSCGPNFRSHDGHSTTVCQRTGHWMPSPLARCVCSGCAVFRNPPNGRIEYRPPAVGPPVSAFGLAKGFYSVGTAATLICPERTDVSHRRADTALCTDSGWVPSHIGSCEIVCPILELPNGRIVYTDERGFDQNTNTNGTVATAMCDTESRLVNGSGSALCLDGEWSTRNLGACEPLICPKLEERPHGRILYSNREGGNLSPATIARLHCDVGTAIAGAGETICEATEKWQPQLGHCLPNAVK